MEGWIKLHRRLLEWEWYDDNNVVRVFLHLLLTANFETKRWRGIVIERGQFVTSINELANATNLSPKQTRIALDKLKSTNEIDTKGANKYTLITICKYDAYQSGDDTEGQTKGEQTANKGRTKGNQRATTKEYKEYKKERTEESIDCTDAPKPTKKKLDIEPIIAELPIAVQEIVRTWIEYKKEQHNFTYKSEKSFQMWLKDLYDKSGGNIDTMKAIVEQSIANGYKGIFEIKKQNYGHTQISTERISELSDAMLEYERQIRAGVAK